MDYKCADKLIELRKNKGLSQEELAEQLGVSRQAVSNWERGETLPDTKQLIALSNIYDVSVDELLGLEREPKAKGDRCADSIFIEDEDGDYVSISKDGVFIENEKDSVSISKDGVFINGARKDKCTKHYIKSKNEKLAESIINGVVWGLALIAYIVLGCILTQDNYVGWRVGWILFIVAAFISSVVEAIIQKKPSLVGTILLATAVYLFLGMTWGMWHPYWAVYGIVIIYNAIVCPIEKYKSNTKKQTV